MSGARKRTTAFARVLASVLRSVYRLRVFMDKIHTVTSVHRVSLRFSYATSERVNGITSLKTCEIFGWNFVRHANSDIVLNTNLIDSYGNKGSKEG